MRVQLLGPLSAEAGGVELALGGLKQRAVFALLVIHAGRVVPLDRIADQLWSDEPPSRATMALQSYVSRLRRVLAEAGAGGADVPQIVTRPPGWMLTLDPGDVDSSRFVSMVDQGRLLLLEGTPEGAARAKSELESALALWVGDPLGDLDSVGFAHEEAGRLGEVRLAAIELLLEARLAEGESGSVVEPARGFVTENPFRERGWCSLMLALYRSGRQAEAVAAAARLRRSLADELGLDPSPEVQELERRILQQDPALRIPSAVSAVPSSRAAALVPSFEAPLAVPSAEQVLVGREDASASVADAVRLAVQGQGRLLVLEAPPGQGKSTMLGVVADLVTAAGGVAVTAGGSGGGGAPALWPWVTIVRALDAPDPPGDRAEVDPGADATAFLRLGTASGSDSQDGALDRARLYRGVLDRLRAERARAPLAVLLDDAQWVDADTLTLLALAVEELTAAGVLFAVAYRSGETPGEVATLLDRVPRERVTKVALRSIDAAEVGALIAQVSGADVDPAVAEAICQRTGGNPLFVVEMVRLLASERRMDAAAVQDALPAQVRDVLTRRLDRLPEQTVALMTVVAIAGGPTDVRLLAQVSGLDEDSVVESCETGLLAELLMEDVDAPDAFVLSHDLVRTTLEQSLSDARRARLHAKVAAAIQARGALSPEQVVDVARHLTAAASVVGYAAAIPFLVDASEDAVSRFAHDAAERFLQDALDLAGHISDPAERDAAQRQISGRLAIFRGYARGKISAQYSTEEAASVPAPTDADSTAGWLGAAVMTGVAGNLAAAAAMAEHALATGSFPVAETAAQYILGWVHYLWGNVDPAKQAFAAVEASLAVTHDITPSVLTSIAVTTATYSAVLAHVSGDDAEADALMSLAASRARGADVGPINVALADCWLAAMRGSTADARAAGLACSELAHRHEYPTFDFFARIVHSWADAVDGDPAAPGRFEAAYEDYLGTGGRVFLPFYLLLQAEAHAALDDMAAARRLVAESRAATAEYGEVCLSPRLAAFAERVEHAD